MSFRLAIATSPSQVIITEITMSDHTITQIKTNTKIVEEQQNPKFKK